MQIEDRRINSGKWKQYKAAEHYFFLSLHFVCKEQTEHKSGQKKKINKKNFLVYLMDVIIHIGLSYLSLSIILSFAEKKRAQMIV